MFLGLRFTTTALWLIVAALIDPRFQAGGKYWTLIMAFLIALGSHYGRRSIGIKYGRRVRGLIGGLCMIPVLIAARVLIPGISLSLPGIILLFLGMFLTEMAIPNEKLKENDRSLDRE